MESHDHFAAFSVHEIFEKCIGCKWTLHVLSQIPAGVMRPGQLERTAAGLTTKVLNERLTKLMRLGIIDREAHPEIPPRVEYRLTDFGDQFIKIIDQVDELQRRFTQVDEQTVEPKTGSRAV